MTEDFGNPGGRTFPTQAIRATYRPWMGNYAEWRARNRPFIRLHGIEEQAQRSIAFELALMKQWKREGKNCLPATCSNPYLRVKSKLRLWPYGELDIR